MVTFDHPPNEQSRLARLLRVLTIVTQSKRLLDGRKKNQCVKKDFVLLVFGLLYDELKQLRLYVLAVVVFSICRK